MDKIVNTSDRLAHLVLVALCHDTEIHARALDLLVKLEQSELATNGTKRKAGDDGLLVCTQCDQTFMEEDNSETACNYHEGEFLCLNAIPFAATHDPWRQAG